MMKRGIRKPSICTQCGWYRNCCWRLGCTDSLAYSRAGWNRRNDVNAISRRLKSISDGNIHLPEEQETRSSKLARLSTNGLSLDTKLECEDVRSGNFATEWNAMPFGVVGVLAMSQVVTLTANKSTSKLDILIAKASKGKVPHESEKVDFDVIRSHFIRMDQIAKVLTTDSIETMHPQKFLLITARTLLEREYVRCTTSPVGFL